MESDTDPYMESNGDTDTPEDTEGDKPEPDNEPEDTDPDMESNHQEDTDPALESDTDPDMESNGDTDTPEDTEGDKPEPDNEPEDTDPDMESNHQEDTDPALESDTDPDMESKGDTDTPKDTEGDKPEPDNEPEGTDPDMEHNGDTGTPEDQEHDKPEPDNKPEDTDPDMESNHQEDTDPAMESDTDPDMESNGDTDTPEDTEGDKPEPDNEPEGTDPDMEHNRDTGTPEDTERDKPEPDNEPEDTDPDMVRNGDTGTPEATERDKPEPDNEPEDTDPDMESNHQEEMDPAMESDTDPDMESNGDTDTPEDMERDKPEPDNEPEDTDPDMESNHQEDMAMESDTDPDMESNTDPESEEDTEGDTEPEPEPRIEQEEHNHRGLVVNPQWPTPKRMAHQLCTQMAVTPTPTRLRSLMPYTTTIKAVTVASSKVKKELFQVANIQDLRMGAPIAKLVQVSRRQLRPSEPKTARKDATKARYARIVECLCRPDNSAQFPSKRDHINGQTLYGLTHTLRYLYQKYVAERKRAQLEYQSKATFHRARPKYARTITFTQRRQCLCIKCANIALLSAVVPGLPKSPQDVAETADTVIEQQLSNLPPEPVRTRQWIRCPVFHKGKTYKKTKLIDVSLTNNEMRALLCGKQFEKYRDHCARIATQYDTVRLLKETLQPHTEATVQMDYSENWAAKYSDEISAAYYDSDQTTLYPMVVHYHNEDNTLKWKSYVGVSSVGQHSVPTHYAFMVKLMEQLKVLLPDLEVLHFITDGPANQYRNRTIAALVAVFEQLHGIRATWTWLEGGHRKGPCDGIGGGLKRKLDNLVKGGVVMRDIDELISAVNTPDLNMILIKVKPEELRVQISKWTTSRIKGIMDKHACVAVQGGVSVRDVSCFAPCCRTSPTCNGWKTIPINVTGDILESSSEGSSCESSDAEENAAENAEQNAEQNVPHSTDEDDVPLAKPKAKSNAKSKTRSKTKAKSKGNVQVETEVEKEQSTDDEYAPHSTDEDDVPLAKPKAKSNAKSKTRSKTKAKSKGNIQVEAEVEKEQSTDDVYAPHSTDEDDVPLAKPKAKSNAKSKTRSKTKAKSKGNVQVETEVEKEQSTDDEYAPHLTDEDDVPLAKLFPRHTHVSNSKAKSNPKSKTKSKANAQVEKEVENAVTIGDYITVLYNNKWYPVKVVKIKGAVLHIHYMKPYRGKWVWSTEADPGTVEVCNVLTRIQKPTPIGCGKVHDVSPTKREEVQAKTSLLLKNVEYE